MSSANNRLGVTLQLLGRYLHRVKAGLRRHWIGLVVITLLTLIFFGPVVIRAGSYTDGGDAMFNAWTLARDQHCIMRQGCPTYANGNIYYPHKDTMLYSETQLSAGLVTLPLSWINKNPIFSYNVLTVLSFLFSGIFMYLLAKYLSRGKEAFSILAGLIFEFAPLKLAATGHLQNLSIFCLPLIVLFILKYFERKSKTYLWLLLIVLMYQFYASWYQMVFVLIALGSLLLAFLVLRLQSLRSILIVSGVVAIATISTAPLARDYIRFSKANNASFGIIDQTMFSSSVADYFIPHNGTYEGRLYYSHKPTARVNAFNLDSYSYAGLSLYAVAGVLIVISFIALCRRKSKQIDKEVLAFAFAGLVGLVASFGPLLKIKDSFTYSSIVHGVNVAIPMPYLIIDKLVPQLHFIRAIGRISVLFLFVLCCLLAYSPRYLSRISLSKNWKLAIQGLLVILLLFELMPTRIVGISPNSFSRNLNVPAVYKYVASHPNVNNIVILRSKNDYDKAAIPTARAEDVLWAGYHNRNIFNGYSGYEPPEYGKTYGDFVDFKQDDINKMHKLGLKYVLVDKALSSPDSQLVAGTHQYLNRIVYQDSRYVLYGI